MLKWLDIEASTGFLMFLINTVNVPAWICPTLIVKVLKLTEQVAGLKAPVLLEKKQPVNLISSLGSY